VAPDSISAAVEAEQVEVLPVRPQPRNLQGLPTRRRDCCGVRAGETPTCSDCCCARPGDTPARRRDCGDGPTPVRHDGPRDGPWRRDCGSATA